MGLRESIFKKKIGVQALRAASDPLGMSDDIFPVLPQLYISKHIFDSVAPVISHS